ncbi:MAG: DUF3616 domain-containing protein [Blastocatellia bacterium]
MNKLSKKKELRHGLSSVMQVGNTIWVTNDETISLERLSLRGITDTGIYEYGEHKQFALNDYLPLPAPPLVDPAGKVKVEEADIEGLDYKDGYLWLVGSHSLKRKQVDENDSIEENFKRLAKVSTDGNRFLLARIPLVESGGTYTLEKETDDHNQKRTAALLRCSAEGSALTEALAADVHLKDFLAIPGKDNGFDIEGLAVVGSRVFVGLRGPVLRGWAVVLELEPVVESGNPSALTLKEINQGTPQQPTYRKHFLDLGGLGIRDLYAQGSDLLILAGPTMDLDGPVSIFRWSGGAQPERESIVGRDVVSKVKDIPYGQGKDHAEGMTLFSNDTQGAESFLIVYDSASKSRLLGESSVKADIFSNP